MADSTNPSYPYLSIRSLLTGCLVLGCFCPFHVRITQWLYASALETDRLHHSVAESLVSVVYWFPFYYTFKFVFLLWLSLPAFKYVIRLNIPVLRKRLMRLQGCRDHLPLFPRTDPRPSLPAVRFHRQRPPRQGRCSPHRVNESRIPGPLRYNSKARGFERGPVRIMESD